jgi:hypothetical protein
MRWLGFLFSAIIAGSFALPWIDSPVYGSYSLLDGARQMIDANPNIADISDLPDLSELPNAAPDVDPNNTLAFAAIAFAVSFPLAALFALIGLLGYYGKWMGVLLGGIPVGLIGYAGYAAFRARAEGFLDQLPPDAAQQFLTQAQTHLGLGGPAYLIAGVLLFFTAIFAPSRR